MTISDGPAWLGDDPIEIALAATHDEYDRAGFVDATTDVLNRLRSQTTSAVTGLVGPWGSGKTSLLRMIEDELVNHAEPGFEWIVSTFNPWTYGDVVSLQTGFFSELRKAFPKGRQWRDVDSLIGSIATRVAPIGALGSFVGVDATGVIESLGKQFSDRSTAKVESRATSALAGMGKPILMIIDDIDRLTATELLEVFKLVRLVGRLPNVYYLLSYDEQTVTDLLLKTDLVGSSSSRRAAEYLEKMIQVRFDIPSLREYQIDNVANAAFAALANSAGGMTRDTQARLRTTFNHAIRPRLRTIRSLRRYFGQIDAFLPAVQGHLDFADFCAVTWIRVSEPGVYAWMQNRKLDLLGLTAYSERHLKTEGPEEVLAQWTVELKRANVDPAHVDDVLWVIGRLFPRARYILEGNTPPNFATGDTLRISNGDYFERYFKLGVPAEDIADSAIEKGFLEIARNIQGGGRAALEQAYLRDPLLVLRKMQPFLGEAQYASAHTLSWFAIQHERSAPPTSMGSTRDALVDTALLTSVSLPTEAFRRVMSSTKEPGRFLMYIAVIYQAEIAGASHNPTEATMQDWAAGLLEYTKESFLPVMAPARTIPVFEVPEDLWNLLSYWKHYDLGGVKSYVDEACDSGTWSRLDVLARSFSAMYATGVDDTVGTLPSFDPKLEPWVDLDATLAEVGAHDSNLTRSVSNERRPATHANRLLFAWSRLGQHLRAKSGDVGASSAP